MKRAIKAFRKLVITLVGLPIVIIGLILIPLPGPGVLVTAAGLFILSLEFDWADRYLQRFKKEISKLINKAMEKAKEKQEKLNSQDKK